MNSHVFPRTAIAIAAILVGFKTYAQAGPPLIVIASRSGKRIHYPSSIGTRKGVEATT